MEIVQISPSAYVLRDPKSSINVGCVVTPDGVILVDSGCTAQLAAGIPARVREITEQPIAYVISTQARAEIAMQAHFDAPVIAHASAARPADAQSPATVSFTEDGYLYVGGVLLELLHAPGRHEGSLAVHLPDERVLFAGDAVHVDTLPMTANANAFRWRETLVRLRSLSAGKVVPGRGRVATQADVDRHIGHLQSLIASADLFKPGDERGLEFAGEGEPAVAAMAQKHDR